MDGHEDYGYEDAQDYPFEEVAGSGDENRIRGNWYEISTCVHCCGIKNLLHRSAKTDYLFSVIAFIFALGNLWRFPSQLAENGGLAYLVPYLVLFFLTALPILLMESALGQFVSLGPLSVWKICPLFKVSRSDPVSPPNIILIQGNWNLDARCLGHHRSLLQHDHVVCCLLLIELAQIHLALGFVQ